jgi:hypothetical protein
MRGAARLRSKRCDTFSVLDNYGLPPERVIVRFGDDGEGWRNMRKRLSEFSLRGRRVLFLSKLALSTRQCGKHRHNLLIVRAYQLVLRIVKWRQPQLTQVSNITERNCCCRYSAYYARQARNRCSPVICSDISPALHAAKPVRTQRHGEHQAHHAAPSAGGSRRSAVLSTLSHSSLLGAAPVFGVEAGSSWADPRGPFNSYFKRTYGKSFSIVTVPPVKLRPAAPVRAPFVVRA